jgi:hypothetical protein
MNCTGTVPIVAGLSIAHRIEGGISWDARFVVDIDAARDFRGGAIMFAAPLPDVLAPQPGIEAIVDGGRITGLCVSPTALENRTIHAYFTQLDELSSRHDTQLGVPIVAGSAVQMVDAAVGDELRLESVRGGGLAPHVGFLAASGIGHDAREEARRLTDAPLPVGRTQIYVRGDDLRTGGALEGHLLGTRAKSPASITGAALAFGFVVLALVALARRLRRAASIERADAVLAAEIDAAAPQVRG